MCKLNFTIYAQKLLDSEVFIEASREELRVLLALVASGGVIESEERLSSLIGASRARCRSALTLWEESGIIKRSGEEPTIVEEFEERIRFGAPYEEKSLTVAKSIRDDNLASAIEECARLMGRAALNTAEMKQITALSTQYGLTAEYILTLASHMATRPSKLTPAKLRDEAIRLTEKKIDNTESLEEHLKAIDRENATDREFRKVLGIKNRNLSDAEISYFRKWANEYGYGVEILTEAYNISSISTAKLSMPHIDKILENWHAAGCKTISECLARSEQTRAQLAIKADTQSAPRRQRSQPPKPRYGDFDTNDALAKAIARSFSDDDDE